MKIWSFFQSPLHVVTKTKADPPAFLLPSYENIALCPTPIITTGLCISWKG